jgi:molybdate transport system substrate-binding protein
VPFEALQIGSSGGGVVTAPKLEMVDRFFGRNVESGQGRLEDSTLEDYELQRRPSQTLEEGQLELELDPHFPDMGDRAIEPRIESPPPGSCCPVYYPIRTGISRLGVIGRGQSGIDQAIEGPIDQRPPHRDHAPHVGIRLKSLGDGEAVRRPLSQQTEDGVFGERWIELLPDHQSRLATSRIETRGEQIRTTRLFVTTCVLGIVVACSNSSAEGELLVSAAASLKEAFGEVESAFEEENPDVDVVLNLGSSAALREQILEGAPADVFASANTSNMDQVVEAGEVAGEPEIFVTNLLQIAVPVGNPGGVAGLEDFAREGLLIGLCAEDVPCGDFGRQALENAGVTPALDTNEPDVRALLTKIENDELDAGIVYVTDVLSSPPGEVEGIDIPTEVNVVAEYPIAVLVSAPNPDAAAAWVEFVLSDDGQAILTSYGFASP